MNHSQKKAYITPCLHHTEGIEHPSLMATSWEMQDDNGNPEDDFGIIEGDPEGGLSSKPRWSLWD